MAAMVLPGDAAATPAPAAAGPSPVVRLCSPLVERFGIEVPVYDGPGKRQTLSRVSARAYNDLGQYARLADALEVLLERG